MLRASVHCLLLCAAFVPQFKSHLSPWAQLSLKILGPPPIQQCMWCLKHVQVLLRPTRMYTRQAIHTDTSVIWGSDLVSKGRTYFCILHPYCEVPKQAPFRHRSALLSVAYAMMGCTMKNLLRTQLVHRLVARPIRLLSIPIRCIYS